MIYKTEKQQVYNKRISEIYESRNKTKFNV